MYASEIVVPNQPMTVHRTPMTDGLRSTILPGLRCTAYVFSAFSPTVMVETR
jgi:hypothetical protein